MADEASADRAMGLEARLSRIEAIVEQLEQDGLELDEALDMFEEGIAHVREARRLLSEAELRIERLVDDGEGGTRLETMERDGE